MNKIILIVVIALFLGTPVPGRSASADSAADRVTRLADAFVAEYKRRFPIQVMYTGAPLDTQSGLDINRPQDLARWRRFVYGIERSLKTVSESELVGRPEWVTRAYLSEGIELVRADDICRSELLNISPFGWVFQLPTIVAAQPVATVKDRREALARWRSIAAWLDQDTTNLATGLRRGFAAHRAGVKGEIEQIDAFIAAPPDKWPTTVLAQRAADPEFSRELNDIATRELRPAAKRYRDFLEYSYLPQARTTPSSISLPQGMACLRARLSSSTTVDMDPRQMFSVLDARRQTERARMLELARQAYGTTNITWEDFGQKLRHDPRDVFADPAEIRPTYAGIIGRARAALPRMVLTPPSGDIIVELGDGTDMYVPASDDGSRPPTFLFAGPGAHRIEAPSLAMHETIPGHYLQDAMRKQDRLHPITRLVLVLGPMEGWATYAESWAAELGLYSSPLDELGGWVNSMTPAAVAELGMQVMGWSEDQASTYLRNESPLEAPTGEKPSVAAFVDGAGWPERYPIGALQYEAMRKRAQDALGARFDSREYHQMLLSDGALPFWALTAKVDRWLTTQRGLPHQQQ